MPAAGGTATSRVAGELARTDLFGDVDGDTVERLASHATVRRLRAGQVLFVAGDPGDHLVLVRSGRVRVLVSSERGDELVLTVLGAGEVLGELSVIDDLPRSATVEAVDTAEVVLLPAADARTVLLDSPAAMLAVARTLAGQVRRLTGGTADLVFLDLPRRLAKLMLAHAVPRPDGRHVADLATNQSGLAARLGTTRQSVNRALAGLVRRGWIETDGSRVIILDARALSRFGGSA